MFQELALNPDVQDKLLGEVESVVPDGKLPTYQDLQKMPYLKAIVKETLRFDHVKHQISIMTYVVI